MKLSKWFLFVPVVIIGFLTLFYSAYKEVKERTLNEFKNQQLTLEKQASRGIESFFIYYQRELHFLSKLPYISDLNEQGKQLLNDFFDSHSDQIEAITVVDSHGILQYTYPYNEEAMGKDISAQKHVKTIMETQKPTVSDVFTTVQGFRAIAYHVPIIKDNSFKGSIAILIAIDNLSKRFIENIRTGEKGYGCMISEDGFVLFNPSEGQTGESVYNTYKNFPDVISMFRETSSKSEGTSICLMSPDGKNVNDLQKTIAGYYRVPLGNTFWTIIIFTPEKEIFGKLTSFRNRLYILFSLILLVVTIYFYLSLKATTIIKEEHKRKEIEIILRESEQRFRTIFELSPAGIILIDENGTVIEVNSTFCESLGYSRDEIAGKNIRVFAQPEADGEIEKNINRILSGETIRHEVKNFAKDKSTCYIDLYETMILLPDGKPGILSVSNDITQKKLAQEKMLTLSRALESIGECVSITDKKNKIIFVNNALCNTYGYDNEELVGKNISIIKSKKEDDSEIEEIVDLTLRGGWNGEVINQRKDGSLFPVELSTSTLKDENNNPIALIGVAVDITERKKAERELINSKEKAEESDRLK